ncbi:4414_t:CDS:2, partial [Gigaspora rosea]
MASDERETHHFSENNARRSFGGYDDISRQLSQVRSLKEKLKLAMWPLKDLENTSIDVYNLLQEYYSDYHSSEAYLPNLSLHSPAYAFSSSPRPIFNQQDNYHSKLQIEYSNLVELSDSSSQSESDDDNITSQHKYLFNIHIDDTFGTFEKVEKKLDQYAIEHGFAVRKSRTHTRDDETVWNATRVCYLSGQWKSKKTIDPDNQ